MVRTGARRRIMTGRGNNARSGGARRWSRGDFSTCSARAEEVGNDVEEKVVNVVDEAAAEKREIAEMLKKPYKWGFVSDIQSDKIPKGLNEDTVRLISSIKKEPEWMLQYRLKAFATFQTMTEPDWSDNRYPSIDLQDITYYAEPRQKEKKASLDEVDPELLDTFEKLGIPITEQKRLANVAVDAVFDSVSIATTFREDLAKVGVIFCSLSEAIQEYPDLVKKYLGSVVRARPRSFSICSPPPPPPQQQQQHTHTHSHTRYHHHYHHHTNTHAHTQPTNCRRSHPLSPA